MAVDFPRETALKIIYDIDEKGAYSNIALNKYLEAYELKDVDKAFITELVYGTVKWRLSIDWIIRQFSSIRLKKISPWILNILRLGVYQLLYTDRIPESAAVNESVNLAKKYGHGGSVGFANALLRAVSRGRNTIRYPDQERETLQYLSVRYSYPEWMVSRFLELYGREFTEELLDSGNQVPGMSIRVNTLKTTRDKLAAQLEEQQVEAVPGKYAPEALVLKNAPAITRWDTFKNGEFQVQDESSMLVGRVLDPKPGELVIDACSAPGGKATHLAQLMENRGRVLARDVHIHKIKLIEDAAQRLGLNIIETEVFDATVPDERYAGKADRVLLDAPCTGLGIIRRKPDIKWARDTAEVGEIVQLQRKLLESVSRLVKPGGILVYSTCTVLPEENSDQAAWFIKEHPDFELDDIRPMLPDTLADRLEQNAMIQLFPNRDGIDGFFIAKFRKRKKA